MEVTHFIDRAEERRKEVEIRARAYERSPYIRQNYHLDTTVFDPTEPQIEEDVLRIIIQYLKDNGYNASVMTIQDETNLKVAEDSVNVAFVKRMRRAILDGDWNEVKSLSKRNPFKHRKSFLYAVNKQMFLELIESGEISKAFNLLMEKIKPLEHSASDPTEFKNLCYVLTCRSVRECPAFRNWDGAKGLSREKLVEQFQSLLNTENSAKIKRDLPPHRLVTLLQQAVARQISASRFHPRVLPKIETLLTDYSSFIVPNQQCTSFVGHKANVKSIEFIGEEGGFFASGSSDNSVKLWDVNDGKCFHTIENAHSARIWDISSSKAGKYITTASGDGSVKLWNLRSESEEVMCTHTFLGHDSDVYSVRFHPGQNHIASAGYDHTIRLWDIRTGKVKRIFRGHHLSIASAVFNPYGNLIFSGSKDSTIRVWDIISGLCVRTFSAHLGEVTSVAINSTGDLLLSASKDNSNRLWDLRMARAVRKFKGHQNTSKNFVRAVFGPSESLVISGSEDGIVYLWDLESGYVLQKLEGHRGMVFDVKWNSHQSLLLSSSDDGTITSWTQCFAPTE